MAVEEVQGYLPITASQQRGRELFALTVQGESMKNAGILDGDYVVVERTPTARDGDIVVALIEDEVTVKRLYRETDCVRLQPENDAFEPIYAKEVLILGKSFCSALLLKIGCNKKSRSLGFLLALYSAYKYDKIEKNSYLRRIYRMIGIIGAMDMEVNGLKERMLNTQVETIGTIEF